MRSKHGGIIAQHFALIYPTKVKTLTLVATAAKFNPTSIIKSRKLMKYASVQDKFKVYSTALYSREFRRKLKKEDALYQTFYDDFAEDPIMFQDYVNRATAISAHKTIDSLHFIKQSTLILTGDDNHLITGLEHS